jgi:hypothetical protein
MFRRIADDLDGHGMDDWIALGFAELTDYLRKWAEFVRRFGP